MHSIVGSWAVPPLSTGGGCFLERPFQVGNASLTLYMEIK